MADDRDRADVPRRRGLRAHVGSGLRVRRPGDAIDEPRGDDVAPAPSEIRPDKPTWVIAAPSVPDAAAVALPGALAAVAVAGSVGDHAFDPDRDPDPIGGGPSIASAARVGLRSNGRRGLRAYSRPSLLRAHLQARSEPGPVAVAAGDTDPTVPAVVDASAEPIPPRDDRRG